MYETSLGVTHMQANGVEYTTFWLKLNYNLVEKLIIKDSFSKNQSSKKLSVSKE